MDPLYQKQIMCPCCRQEFHTSRVRPSLKKSIKHDSDFCTYYREGQENPDFYVVRVCPFCGFASTESSVAALNDRQRAAIQEKITSSWQLKDYGGKRGITDAMYTFKLALLCAQLIGEKSRVVAGLLHHIAWLYRHQGNMEGELRFLRYALDEYIRVFETEAADTNSARLMYLIGDLHRRLKEYPEAVKWFGRVINDRRITDASMIRACREGWAAVREEMLESKLDLPEEMQQSAGGGKT